MPPEWAERAGTADDGFEMRNLDSDRKQQPVGEKASRAVAFALSGISNDVLRLVICVHRSVVCIADRLAALSELIAVNSRDVGEPMLAVRSLFGQLEKSSQLVGGHPSCSETQTHSGRQSAIRRRAGPTALRIANTKVFLAASSAASGT